MSGIVKADVNTDYGALLVGGLFAFSLSGCVNAQFILYWQICSEDRWTKKSLVTVAWFIDLCHSALVAVTIWRLVFFSHGNLEGADTIPWSAGAAVALTAVMTFLVQCFYAHRIYRLQYRKLMVASLVVVLAFIRFVAAIIAAVGMLILKRFSEFTRYFPGRVFTTGLALSALIDIMITTCICCFLRSNRSSLIPSTNRIIVKLTFWTVQNGSITCIGVIASLVCVTVMPRNRIFLGLHFVIAKLYANSLFSSLNARRKFRNSQTSFFEVSISEGAAGDNNDERRGP